jgi:death on curing protein
VTYYPGIEEVISAHSRLIARFGGILGIRDRAALESALARPQTGYYDDLIQEAAALSVNGYKLEFEDDAAYQFMIELYESGTFRFAELETWLRQHARLAGSPGR